MLTVPRSPSQACLHASRSAAATMAANRTSSGMQSVAEAGGFTPKPRVKPAPAGTYRVGDTVLHKAFGTGLIVSATPMANDTLLEVAFDKVGTKKLFANFARLTKV